MRNNEIRTLSDWAEANLLAAGDPLIAGDIAGQIRRAVAANDNFLRPETVWPAEADDFEESKHQNRTAFDGEESLVITAIFISYFAAAMLLLLVADRLGILAMNGK